MLSYYILDTETTGLSSDIHEIVQVSVLRFADKFQTTRNVKAKHPERASPEALRITKKTINDLKFGDERSDVVKELTEFFMEDDSQTTHRCIVAHNASFDQRFCHAMWQREGLVFPADLWLCTKEFTRKYAKKQGLQKIAEIQGTPKLKLTLEYCLKACELKPISGAHNAVVDTYNTLNLFQFLMDQNIGHASVMKNNPHRLSI